MKILLVEDNEMIIKAISFLLTEHQFHVDIANNINTAKEMLNKTYDLVTTNDITSYTTYYVNEYNDKEYYVPVTKYVNTKDDDIVKVIIKELNSSPIYETNLMSYLNAGATLETYELSGNNLKLNFN